MKKIILIIAILILSNLSFAQPTNDDCTNAEVITDLAGGCTTIDNTGATHDSYIGGNCQAGTNNIWFSFTAQGGDVDIDVSADLNPDITLVYAATGDPCTAADVTTVVEDCAGGNNTTISVSSNDLIVGQVYYAVITSNTGGSGNSGPVTICVTNPPAPINDDCGNAIEITTLDGTCIGGTNTSASFDNYIGGCQDGSSNVWYSFTAEGFEATIDITGTGIDDPEISISTAPGGDPCSIVDAGIVDCQSTAAGTTAQLVGYPLTIGQVYYVQVSNEPAALTGAPGDFDICITNPETLPGALCESAAPFCTENPTVFPAETNTTAPIGPAYNCLLAQPNPTWFYLEVATSGDIELTMTNSAATDIDFIVWGPVTDVATACDSEIDVAANVAACSFSTSATEVATISAATVGETYMVMITNYANAVTDITLSQSGGTGATDCSILPVALFNLDANTKGNYNIIDWTTVSETNNDYFTLEYSTDAKSWSTVHTIKGIGTSTTTNDYQYRHSNYYDGTSYYRLSQTDFDGETNYFSIVNTDNSKVGLEIVKIINLMGQDVDADFEGMRIIIYNDGSTIKKIGK